MKILIISDLHYEKIKPENGIELIDQNQLDFLFELINYHKPNILLSNGDLGEAINEEIINKIKQNCIFYVIYGNHDNIEILRKTGVLIEDGEIKEIEGIKISGINGIIGFRKTPFHKKPNQFLEIAEKLKEKEIDILLIHEVPIIEDFVKQGIKYGSDVYKIINQVIEIVKPKIVINGHLHKISYKYLTFNNGKTHYFKIITSPARRHYLIIKWNEKIAEIWKNFEKIYEIELKI